MTYGEWNGHVIEVQDGGLAEVCTPWVLFLVIFAYCLLIWQKACVHEVYFWRSSTHQRL